MINKKPVEIVLANLEVIVMPSGEVLSGGKSFGYIETLGKYLTPTKSMYGQPMKGDELV